MPRLIGLLVALGLVASLAISACTSEEAAANIRQVEPSEAVEMLAGRTVIDVRTPEEYAAGHVTGAINIHVEGPDFRGQIAELDRDEPYLLYCRTGRRSALAADIMAEEGFKDVADAAGLKELALAGAPIEQ
jgi:rhodanese-related sulfurtransferase